LPAERSDLGTAVITAGIATATTAAAGTARLKAVTTAVAAIFPAAGAGTPIAVATAGIAAPAAAAVAAAGTGVTTTAATAVAATSSAIATPAATTTATTTATATAGFGLVDAQRTAHQFGTLQTIDGPGFGFRISHLHEGETPFATGVALQGEGTTDHLAERGEQLCNVFLLSTEGEVTDENAHRLTGTTDKKGK
jgi:hypothetical protein